jgi:pimeloyl-ACP methyl ester carboxylesterase/DNA-binding CsgD family transcriptional regulator
MIILDDRLQLIYHNHSAEKLYRHLRHPVALQTLKPAISNLIRQAPEASPVNRQNALLALNLYDENSDQIYLRSIQSQTKQSARPTLFHILMVLDHNNANEELNADLVVKYGLTEKEQNVLVRLIHGESIKNIAEASFVSDNTVKSHLKSIFRKTSTKSQGALISLILTHESQVLDSYFESNITTAIAAESNEIDRQITLSSGQTIAYCDYGPAEGRPIVVFHSGFGSRLAIPPDYQQICERTNRRIIVPDRPGLGKTDFIEGHPAKWNSQLQEFIDLLEIDKYDILGCIISTQMAMSYAASADARLEKVILTSPVFINTDDDTRYLTEILAPAARYVKQSAQFARDIYELWLKSVTLNLDKHYKNMLEESIGSAEREQFDKENLVQLLTDIFKEGARHSLDGILNEMVFCMTPLNLDLAKFTKPVEAWCGTEDKRITMEGVKAIFKELPNCQLHFPEGYSEHLYYSLFEEIIR